MNLSHLSVLSLCLFIITFPLSVTISQSFAVLGSVFFILDANTKKNLLRKMKYPIFIMGTLLYLSFLLSYVKHFSGYQEPLNSLLKGEFSDIWFCIVFLASGFLSRDRNNLNYFKISFFVSLGIVLVTGLISIFTPYRLASFVNNGFVVPEGSRLQHYAGDLFGIKTYLPIGMMNTHLTFGGILGLFYPGLIAYYIYKFPERKEVKNIFYSIIIFLYTLLLFYNQSRSVWMGIFFALLTMIYKWRNFLNKFINKKRLFYLLSLFILIILSAVYFFQKNWLLKRALEDSLSESTTENQRYFIYKSTLEIIKHNPFFGVGLGNFSKSHKEYSDMMATEHPELYYDLSITPRGHAHNDFLHLYSIGGVFSLIFYVLFWLLNIKFFLEAEDEKDSILFSGFLILFPAGFFQCYLLDDEVALPFFVFLGIFCGRVISLSEVQKEKERIIRLLQKRKSKAGLTFHVEAISFRNALDSLSYWLIEVTKTDSKEKRKSIIKETSIIIFIPLLISLIYILFLTSKDTSKIFKRKIKIENLDLIKEYNKSLNYKNGIINKKYYNIPVQVEGCLTHNFNEKLELRLDSYKIILTIEESFKNPPKQVKINIISRDSFDQDKSYRAHTQKVISTHTFSLEIGKNFIELPIDIYENSQREVYFRDFQFQFFPVDIAHEEMNLPYLDFGKNCYL